MKIKNEVVAEDDFVAAFDELLKKPTPAKQCLELIKSITLILQHYKDLKKTQRSILLKYSKTDGIGNILLDEKKQIVYKSLEDATSCQKEFSELHLEYLDIPLTNKVKIYEDEVSTGRKLFLLSDVVEVVERPAPDKI